jgi:hypothetical protein
MLLRISCTAFVMEIFELYLGDSSIDIQAEETQEMCIYNRTPLLGGRDWCIHATNVQNEYEVSEVHANACS